jgi:hypothetical protein
LFLIIAFFAPESAPKAVKYGIITNWYGFWQGDVVKSNESRCVIFGCLMAGLIITSFVQAGQTFISNAGFEVNTWSTGLPNNWWFYPAGTGFYHNPEPNKAHSGKAFISMTAGPGGWANVGLTTPVPVARDINYTIAAFVADTNGGQSGLNPANAAVLRVDWYANQGDTYSSLLDQDSIPLTVPKDGNYYYFSGQVRNNSDANYAQVILVANRINGQSPTFSFDDITFAKANPPAKPDYNGDRIVNFIDFAYLAKGYGKSDGAYDMDGDGSFGLSDLALFTHEWIRTIPDIPGYQFVWSDEFDGAEINQLNWTQDVGNGYGLEYWTSRPDNAVVQNGCLVIIAKPEQYNSRSYTSALLESMTKADFLYGRIEARIKLPVGQGIWPAFWMMPTYGVYGGWPHSGEIDILETINAGDIVHGTMHFTNTQGQHTSSGGTYSANGLVFANDYHVYAIEWDPNEIRWYVDDVKYFSQTNWSSDTNPYPAPFNQQFYIILNVAVGGNWAGPPDATTVFPQRMFVDWVRVYQKNP